MAEWACISSDQDPFGPFLKCTFHCPAEDMEAANDHVARWGHSLSMELETGKFVFLFSK